MNKYTIATGFLIGVATGIVASNIVKRNKFVVKGVINKIKNDMLSKYATSDSYQEETASNEPAEQIPPKENTTTDDTSSISTKYDCCCAFDTVPKNGPYDGTYNTYEQEILNDAKDQPLSTKIPTPDGYMSKNELKVEENCCDEKKDRKESDNNDHNPINEIIDAVNTISQEADDPFIPDVEDIKQ